MNSIIRKHFLFIILIAVLAIYLGYMATLENTWDGWAFGSAQTLLSSEHWLKDGFIFNKFLFLPMGYSKVVKYLDEPELRHLARGLHEGQAILIDQRSHYTHYPPGYLLPYATLMKIGFSERYWFRFLSLFFSFTALVFMYWFFNLISNRIVAFFAVSYYAVSTMFLGFADSLANQPIDDFLRFSIMLLSLFAVKARDNTEKYRLYNIFIWIIYFILAISSYDSTFFIFIWLVGLDLVMTKKILWKRWLIFVLAPIAAFTLQFLQNWWYLGYPDVWLDAKGIFFKRSLVGPGNNFFEKHIRSMLSPLAYITGLRVRVILPIIAIVIVIISIFIKKIVDNRQNLFNLKLLAVLALAGASYPFIFTTPGYFDYSGRQFAPFIGLMIGLSIFLLIKTLSKENSGKSFSFNKWNIKFIITFFLLSIFVGFIFFIQLRRTYGYVFNRNIDSSYKQFIYRVDYDIIDFYRILRSLSSNDSIIFYITHKEGEYFTSNPISIREYYAEGLILDSLKYEDVINNYLLLKQYSEEFFDSIIVSTEREPLEKILKALSMDVDGISEIKLIKSRYVMVIKEKL
ncbi:MAG: hypothetical protein NUV64_00435 [Parcubacteria group bacterium]|nr:hypothetical protein [Parcubacteria group bacterium]MCR4342513.1 hypothetical protein [Patescibacteria group bacterium]